MVCQPEAGGSVQVAGSKCTKKIVDRPRSRAGSRATSIKGEPGSALESSASVSVKDKNLSQAKGVSEVSQYYYSLFFQENFFRETFYVGI